MWECVYMFVCPTWRAHFSYKKKLLLTVSVLVSIHIRIIVNVKFDLLLFLSNVSAFFFDSPSASVIFFSLSFRPNFHALTCRSLVFCFTLIHTIWEYWTKNTHSASYIFTARLIHRHLRNDDSNEQRINNNKIIYIFLESFSFVQFQCDLDDHRVDTFFFVLDTALPCLKEHAFFIFTLWSYITT